MFKSMIGGAKAQFSLYEELQLIIFYYFILVLWKTEVMSPINKTEKLMIL